MNQIDLQKMNEQPNSWNMLRTMGGVGILCAILIVFTFQATLPTITRKKTEALENAVFKVLPGTKTKITFRLNENNQFEPYDGDTKGQQVVYAGYDKNGQLVGIALEARGQGFQDVIQLLYGYAPQKQAIVGIQILESKETPGLGNKTESDPDFLFNFKALDVALNDNGSGIRNPIEPVKHGTKEHPWQIDCITGATISSKAIANILKKDTEQFIPLVFSNLQNFEKVQNDAK